MGKLVLRPKQVNKTTGCGPIYITYFVCGKTIEKSTGIIIPDSSWNAVSRKVVSHKDSSRLNGEINEIKRNLDEKFAKYPGIMTPEIARRILNGQQVYGLEDPNEIDFVQYTLDNQRRRYEIHDIGYSVLYNSILAIERFRKFLANTKGEGFISLSSMSISVIDEYKTHRLKEICSDTLNKELAPLKFAISYGVQNGLMDIRKFGDLDDIYIKKERSYNGDKSPEVSNIHYLSHEQMAAFIKLYPTVKFDRTREIMDMFLFSFYACGLRISDIATLEWSHIDFERQMMTKILVKGKNCHEVTLNERAMEILDRWKKKNYSKRFVFNLLPDDFVFSDKQNQELCDKCAILSKLIPCNYHIDPRI